MTETCGEYYPYADLGYECSLQCDLAKDHDGDHHFEIEWSRETDS